jgi:hypothetical protein
MDYLRKSVFDEYFIFGKQLSDISKLERLGLKIVFTNDFSNNIILWFSPPTGSGFICDVYTACTSIKKGNRVLVKNQ